MTDEEMDRLNVNRDRERAADHFADQAMQKVEKAFGLERQPAPLTEGELDEIRRATLAAWRAELPICDFLSTRAVVKLLAEIDGLRARNQELWKLKENLWAENDRLRALNDGLADRVAN